MFTDSLTPFKHGHNRPIRCIARGNKCYIQLDNNEFVIKNGKITVIRYERVGRNDEHKVND